MISKEKSIVFTFGRFNPPTIGHAKLINKVKELGKGQTIEIFMSQTQDNKKNPLSFDEKLGFMKQAFDVPISTDKKLVSPFHVLEMLSDDGWKNVTMVVGSDRVGNFRKQMTPYVGATSGKLQLKFNTFRVISAGERDAKDVNGVSSSKLREFVVADDYNNFKLGVPKGIDPKKLFSILRNKAVNDC